MPDHSAKAYGGTHYRPTEDEALELANRYQFKPGYQLRGALEYAYEKEESSRCISESASTLGEQKDQLRLLRDRCDLVKEVVHKLSINERKLLDDVFDEPLNLRQFEKDVCRIYSASRISLDRLKSQKGHRTINSNIWSFVSHLADIWKKGTGTEPTAGHSDIDQRYVGDFYEFVLQCASMGNVQLSKTAPGAIIVKILIKWRQRK